MRKALLIFAMFVVGIFAAEMPADVRDYTQTDANYYATRETDASDNFADVTLATATPGMAFPAFRGR